VEQPGRTVERGMGAIAGRAFGVATRQELAAAGITDEEIRSRLSRGGLLQEHPGVYRVGHRAPSAESTYMAAVKATGEGTLLAGMAAAYLWGLAKGPPPPSEVISLTERRVPGIVTHRARRQPGADVAVHRGIPVTTVARTLVDLAGVLDVRRLANVCHEAQVRYGTTPANVDAVLRRRPTSKGARKLRRIMGGDYKVAVSALERRFLGRLRASGLPLPVTNTRAGSYRVDCRWPDYGLSVELDSYRFHNSRKAWEQDRRREREARARGDDFRRFTWDDVFRHPQQMVHELTAVLLPKRPG
jgi:very-short-patch-repair endonuclease